jgi:hypothetical protein
VSDCDLQHDEPAARRLHGPSVPGAAAASIKDE